MTTYNDLISDIQAFAENDNTEFTAELPEIVIRGELRLMRMLDLELFESTDESLTAQTTRSMTLPSGVIQVEEMWHADNGDNAWSLVYPAKYSRCLEYAPDDDTTAAVPKYFCQDTTTTLYVSPTPAASSDYRLRVIKRPNGLATGNQNTWLSDNLGDALLWSCMIEAWIFLKNETRRQEAADMTASLLAPALKEVEKLRRRTYKEVANMEKANG